jgi:argininosuccinate lyase
MSEFKKYSKKIDDDVYEVLTVLGSVTARDHIGATSPNQILQAIKKAEINLRKKLS